MEMRVTSGRRARRAGHDRGYTPTELAAGFELRVAGETWHGTAFIVGFSIVWVVMTVIFIVIATRRSEAAMYFFAAVFALSDVLLLSLVWKRLRVRGAWRNSRLILEQWPMRIGTTQTVWFARPLDNAAVTPMPTSAQLVLRETASYQVGTDTRTATRDVSSTPLDLTSANHDGVDGYEAEIEIPSDRPPTIQLDSNLVEWILEFEMEAPRVPSTTSAFTILVSPERKRRR